MRRPVAVVCCLALTMLTSPGADASRGLRGAQCLDPSRARSWITDEEDRVLVDAGRFKYRIQTAHACAALGYSHTITFRGERIADMLGVRREGVTGAALQLQREGLISYSRGHIRVLDRRGLEQQSCECYGVVERAYEQLRGGSSAWPRSSGAPERASSREGRLGARLSAPTASVPASSAA